MHPRIASSRPASDVATLASRMIASHSRRSRGPNVFDVKALLTEQRARVVALGRALAKARGVDHVMVPHVFPHLTGAHRGERIAEFRRAWRKATRAAGMPGLLAHDLRRSAVRNLERAGVSCSVAMKVTGHKSKSVYRRYAIVSDADLQDVAQRLGTLTGTLDARRENPVAQPRRISDASR